MDEIAAFNLRRWQALADADALFTRPHLDLTLESAQQFVDEEGRFGDLAGRDVLCLAGGGGQQSAAFALLGAYVTVFDLLQAQLDRDQQAAAHYNVSVRTLQGDMRDLSALEPRAYDLVYQPYSLNFVPDPRPVFAGVSRVLRPGGLYYVAQSNPFYPGLAESDWNGEGYTLKTPYGATGDRRIPDADWVYASSAPAESLPAPDLRASHEFVHPFGLTLNALLGLGFTLLHVSDNKHLHPDLDAPPATWSHRNAYAPAWLSYWWKKSG